MKIFNAGNTLIPAILLLEQHGFIISCTVVGKQSMLLASRNELILQADDPLQLLGLLTLYQDTRATWQATDNEIEDVMRRYPWL